MQRLVARSTPLISIDAAAIDTETTGLDPRNARIIQIAAIKLRGHQIRGDAVFDRLVNPGIPIPARSTQIHNIADADVRDAATFDKVFPEFLRFIGSSVLIGHNIDFDYNVIAEEAARLRLDWSPPAALDVRMLAQIAAPNLASYSLDALCDWLGVENSKRHNAFHDAMAAAQVFVKLLPKLRERGIRTIAEAETASITQAETLAMMKYGTIAPATGMPRSARADAERVMMRIDAYPYSRRVRDVMTRPATYAPADASIDETAKLMMDRWISAVLVEHQGRTGIVTERDLLRAVAARAGGGPNPKLHEIMTTPLRTVSEDDFIYKALGRIDRLGIRHLPVTGADGSITGMVTPRNLLRQRTTAAFSLGDEIETAEDTGALGVARAKLAATARALLHENIDARDVAAVISAEICAITARAAAIAERRLMAESKGPPPVAYTVLVMGSGGRGESLLAADQDNAIVFEEGEPGGHEDRWLEALGKHMADILDEVGIPYCKGGIMAKNAQWRHSLAGWRTVVDGWVRRSRPEDLLNVDIFFDALPVYGKLSLGQEIRSYAYQMGKGSAPFLKLLSQVAGEKVSPFTLLGGLKTDDKGRLDLKRTGLMPIFTAARILAIKHGIEARSTPERLASLKALGIGAAYEFDEAIEAHKLILGHILEQQLIDANRGLPLGNSIEVGRLGKAEKEALKTALRAVDPMVSLVSEARF